MYQIIQKIYEKHNKILKEGVKKVLNGEDVSSLTSAIKDFTDVLGKELFSEIVTQIEKLEKRIRKKANKKIFGTTGVKIAIGMARDELYYELKDIWYGKAV